MKSERVTLLTTPEFKAFLASEARQEGVSVAELVRSRCERRPSDQERALQELTLELQRSVTSARQSLNDGLSEVQSALEELRARQQVPATPDQAAAPEQGAAPASAAAPEQTTAPAHAVARRAAARGRR